MSPGQTLVDMDVLLTTAWLMLTALVCFYTGRQIRLASADSET